MPRMAKPRKHGEWWVTEAGGRGLHRLCSAEASFETAMGKLHEYLAGLRNGQGLVEVEGGLTLAQLVVEFLDHKKVTKSAGTYENYRFYLGRLLEWYGERDPRKLKLSDGSAYIARLKAIPSITSNVSINHYITSAKAVFNLAVENDRLHKNPWKKLAKLPERGRKRIVTDAEFQKLLDACSGCIAYRGIVDADENAQTMRDILHIMRYTALRPGEIRKLRWDHLHLDEGFIVIPADEHKTGTTAKNPEDRAVPVLAEGMAVLRARQEKYGHQPRVFANVYGEEWSDEVFSNRFRRLRKRAGLDKPDRNGERITWYSLRHTRLTEASAEGWDFYALMSYAGHTTPSMTKRYVHPKREHLRRLADAGEAKRKASARKKAKARAK